MNLYAFLSVALAVNSLLHFFSAAGSGPEMGRPHHTSCPIIIGFSSASDFSMSD